MTLVAELLSLPAEWRWLAVVAADMRGEVHPDTPRRCGAPDWTVDAPNDGVERCDGMLHIVDGKSRRRCPTVILDEIRAKFPDQIHLAGGRGFETHDIERYRPGAGTAERGRRRVECARRALDAMRGFADVRRPSRGVVISGDIGIGKTRLLLSSHFQRLERGWPSVYVTSGQLRPLFRDADNLDADVHLPARSTLHALARARVVHLDDLGDVRGTEAFHQAFAAGLKGLLDAWAERGTRLAVALNLKSHEAARHPDIGERALSRLCADAELIGLEGEDQRLAVRR